MTPATEMTRQNLSQIQNSPRKVVLVVEDDVSLQPVVRRMIRKLNPDTTIDWATDLDNAMTLIEGRSTEKTYDLILTDVFLDGEGSGLDLLRECRRKKIESSCVVTSGVSVLPAASADYPFLPKPFTFETFRRCVGPFLSGPRTIPSSSRHRKDWFWPIAAALWLAVLGAGAFVWKEEPKLAEFPQVLDYDVGSSVRWASPWQSRQVRVRLALLFDPRSELNLLILDPLMIQKFERSQRIEVRRIFASPAGLKLAS